MTTPLLPTFSALPRWFACELVDVLPRVDEPSDDSRAGTVRHAFFQRVSDLITGRETEGVAVHNLDSARELALAEAPPEHQAALAAIPLEALGLDQIAAEVALALDLETGEARELGRGLERNYSGRQPTELVGTIDQLGFIGDAGLAVRDFKGRAHKTAPEKDPQFLAAALAASRVYRRSFAEITVLRVIGDDVFPQSGRVDLVELDAFELRLQDRAAKGEANRAAFAKDGTLPAGEVGDHCRYCPSLRYCPAKMGLARAVLGGTDEEIRGITIAGKGYIDEVSAPRLHALVRDAEKLLELVKDALCDFARQTPFTLADGRVYGVPPNATERELVDGRKVEEVLAELFGAEAAAAGVKVEGTLSGVEAAVKKYLALHPELSKRGAIKELREKAEDLLQKRGLLAIRVGGQVKAFKPKEVDRAA